MKVSPHTVVLTTACAMTAFFFVKALESGKLGFYVLFGLAVGAGLLGFVLRRRGWLRLDGDAKRRLPRIALATALMGIAVAAVLHAAEWLLPQLTASAVGRLELLFVLVAVGMLVYGAVIDLIGVIKLRELAAAVRQSA